MDARTADSPQGRTRTLAQTYRRFAEVEAAEVSPLHGRVARALSESDEALHAIEAAPARRRQPALILAALHDLVLSGRAPELAAAYAACGAAGDGTAGAAGTARAARAAADTLVRMADSVAAIAARRRLRPIEVGVRACAVLHPAIAEVARRAGVETVGLIDVDGSAGLNLHADRVGIIYSDGRSLGDPSAAVQVASTIVHGTSVSARPMSSVAARIAIDRDPIDMTDEDDARWLRACVPPDQPERAAALEAEIALAAAAPVELLRGDALAVLPDALGRVPADALPVVTTTWALSSHSLEGRLRFLHRLQDAAADRPVAWVSVEGVGVSPAIPTLGDRRAFGHSTIGLAVMDRSGLHAEAVGRCWSRGRLMEWLAAT